MSVCMIPSDASHEEAVEWIVVSLEQLINLSNEIFERLSNRIKSFNEHANRVQLNLQQMNSAIVISAPGKFVEIENECQQSILGKGLQTDTKVFLKKINAKHKYDLNESKDVAAILDEKRTFYRFTERKMKPKKCTRQIPDNLQSVADLLLFNTTLNVYTDDRFMDPFNNVKTELHTETESKIQQPAPVADDSTLDVSVKQKADPLQYQPEFGSLQNFSLPESLFNSTSLPPDSLAVQNNLGRDISSTAESQDIPIAEKDINNEETLVKPELTMAENIGKLSSITNENTVNSQFPTAGKSVAYEVSPEATKQQIANSAAPRNETLETVHFPY
ncbi:hypothetical protein DINM_007309 [Dirofilaria immitis]|nr:hypothetical protein [Dirofilaria immitis]